MKPKILVTGGYGYIGSQLMSVLQKNGFDVSSCDIGWFSKAHNSLYQDFSLEGFDLIIHLAGHSSVLMSQNDPTGSWKNNVNDFFYLLEKLTPQQKIIYASSGSVYGEGNSAPQKETDVSLDSVQPYDMSKIAADVIAYQAIENKKNVVGLRFGTVNGLSENTRIDLMLNSMVFSAINFDKINVKNPQINRPILFLDDLCTAVLNIISNFKSGIYNLASINTTVQNAAEIVSSLSGSKIVYLADDKKPYNFQLNTEAFLENFSEFRFCNIEDTVASLLEGIPNVSTGIRERPGASGMLSVWKP